MDPPTPRRLSEPLASLLLIAVAATWSFAGPARGGRKRHPRAAAAATTPSGDGASATGASTDPSGAATRTAGAASPVAAGPSLLFRSVRLFDGQKLVPRADVLVRGGRIAAVGPSLTAPAGAEVIDGADRTLLPGLIDAHVHVPDVQALRQALVFGVTTELDMFTERYVATEVRRLASSPAGADLADMRTAGTLVTPPGGHGTEYGIAIPTLGPGDDAQAFVDARIAEGSDYVKVVYDDGRVNGIHFQRMPRAQLAAVVAAAHARGRLAVVHIASLADARDALEAGADGLAHLWSDLPRDPAAASAVARLAAAHGAFAITTLSAIQTTTGTPSGAALVEDPRLAPFLSRADVRALGATFPARPGSRESLPVADDAALALAAARVPLLAGTDAPNPGSIPGASMHGELALLVSAGLPAQAALVAATSAPAARFHLDDRGRVAVGLRADLLLVRGDPTRDIAATRDIVGVWKQGVRVDRERYRAALAEEAARAGTPITPGLVSDFEGDSPTVRFGAGWDLSTDRIAGGSSVAAMALVRGGAHGSKGALSVTGAIQPGVPYAWAGAMYSPGPRAMTPVDASRAHAVRFFATGDGQTYRIMLFTETHGFSPLTATFRADGEWREYTFPLASFGGTDGHDLVGILFAAGPTRGRFSFKLDDVRLE